MKRTLLFVLILGLLASCKKIYDTPPQGETFHFQNHSNDTIVPSDYIMTYPGSWWLYDNDSTYSCDGWKKKAIHTVTQQGGSTVIDEDQWIIPMTPSILPDLAGDRMIVHRGRDRAQLFHPILDTIPNTNHFNEYGVSTGEVYYYTGFDARRSTTTTARLNSMTIGNNTYYDVLQVETSYQTYWWKAGSWGHVFYHNYWFAKDVGIIKYVKGIDNIISEEGELVDHYIAPH